MCLWIAEMTTLASIIHFEKVKLFYDILPLKEYPRFDEKWLLWLELNSSDEKGT